MTDQPTKRLSLKPKVVAPDLPNSSLEKRTRSRKRIIRRDELPASKLATTKAPPKPKPKKKPASPAPKKPTILPSDIRLDNLNTHLNNYSEAWRDYKPLMIGVEKEVFRHIAKHQLSSSKRVVQRLLRQHTQNERYRRNLKAGSGRYHLNGTKLNPSNDGYLVM